MFICLNHSQAKITFLLLLFLDADDLISVLSFICLNSFVNANFWPFILNTFSVS